MKISDLMFLGKDFNFKGVYNEGKDKFYFEDGEMYTYNLVIGAYTQPRITSFWLRGNFNIEGGVTKIDKTPFSFTDLLILSQHYDIIGTYCYNEYCFKFESGKMFVRKEFYKDWLEASVNALWLHHDFEVEGLTNRVKMEGV